MSAADRAAELLRQLDLDAKQQRDNPMTHAPQCPEGPLVTSKGYSVTTTTCQTCKAVASVRHGAS